MVIFGSRIPYTKSIQVANFDGIIGTIFSGVRAGDQFGDAVGPAGDYNLDGIADLVIGAPNAGTKGDVYVMYGKTGQFQDVTVVGGTVASTAGDLYPASQSQSGIGGEVWGSFDFNGDGRADVAVCLPDETSDGQAGAGVFLVHFDLSP